MQTIGQYEVDSRLGSGAFATVWLANDPQLDALVAIKVLGDNWVGQPDIVRRFIEEARLLRQAEDPRVVDVYTLGTLDTGQPWFAMAHADRGTLVDRISGTQPPLDEALGLIHEMGRCVEAVHRLGAVHRDVKPGNFLIRSTRQDVSAPVPGLASDERLLIGDLGLAKVLSASSGFTVAAGSPLYMAPEQASMSADITFAADVFSLGICAWQVLTGEPPPRGEGLLAAREFETASVPALTTVRADVPAHVEAAIMTAIQENPQDRWATIDDFLTGLTRQPKPAAPPAAPPAVPPEQAPNTPAPVPDLAAAGNPAPPTSDHSNPPQSAVAARNEVAAQSSVAPQSPAIEPQPRSRLPRTLAVAALAVVAALVAVLILRDDGSIAGAPDWFEVPAAATDVSVSTDGDSTSIVAVLPAGFVLECEGFLDTASAASWQLVRDDCATSEAFGSVESAGQTAVVAQLDDGRIGWQFNGS